MNKLILSTCLIAGTAIGAGMMALPMVLCKIGIIPTLLLILSTSFVMYVTGLQTLELMLRMGTGLPFGKLAKFYSGSKAAFIGTFSSVLLMYALLCAYLYGGASILQTFLSAHFNLRYDLSYVILVYAFILVFVLLQSVTKILYLNKILFIFVLTMVGILIIGLLTKLDPSHLPLLVLPRPPLEAWTQAIPVLCTSFGFQVVFHTLVQFCDQKPILLKKSLFWGSIIPAVIYSLWVITTLGVLYYHSPADYQKLLSGQFEVGQFIQVLSQISAWSTVQIVATLISLLAIIKSSLGVGLALLETCQDHFHQKTLENTILGRLSFKKISLFLTIIPPVMVALYVPQLFLKALSAAGVLVVIIAILLPLWLITRPSAKISGRFFYPIAENKILQLFCLLFGLMVISAEFVNL